LTDLGKLRGVPRQRRLRLRRREGLSGDRGGGWEGKCLARRGLEGKWRIQKDMQACTHTDTEPAQWSRGF